MDETERERSALQIFTEICELADPQRSAHIEARCGDDAELRTRVTALLKADGTRVAALAPGAVDQFLETAVGHAANVSMEPSAKPGQTLRNDYRLLRVIGEGGMATVYEAEQTHPRRLVAIKIVRAGSFSAEVRRRFEYEAQMLARLQHPNIAQLFEADTKPEEAHVCAYLAMELVRGVPIDEYAEEHKLTIHQRIELIFRVCDAVEYAHRMGVMHRDLKPANILVQEDGQPKVLDFGVARAIDRDERLATVLTHAGQVIGTLPYMSPEQVEGTQLVDTRADVYALGVLLYKLLTGKVPIDVSNCGIAEAARRICHDVPPPASQQNRFVQGDLDAIAAKSLEKDVERRYRSVQSFAADLRRFLEGRLIEARGGSSFYVLRKTLWRYRQIATIAAAFLAIIVAFGIFSEIQARHNRDLALQAVAARDAAGKNAEQLRRSLYFSNIGFAQAALETNDIGLVYPLLEGCPPDLRGWEWGYLRSLSDRSEQTWQTGTKISPHVVDVTSDHKRIAMGAEGLAVVLDGDGRQTLYSRTFSEGPVAIALSPDGRFLACGSHMDEMCFVDLDSQKELWTTPLQPAPQFQLLRRLRSLRFNPDGKSLAAAGYDGHIRIRDVKDGSILRDIDAKCLSILCMQFTPDGRSIIGGDDRGHVRMWNLADGSIAQEGKPHDGSVACIAISPDHTEFASGANDGKIIIRKLSDWSELKTLSTGSPIVWSVGFSSNGKRLAAGSDDNLLRLWNLDDDSPPALLRGHADTIHFVSFESNDHVLLSAGADATVKRWNLDRLNTSDTIPLSGVGIYTATFTGDGTGVFIGANDGTVYLWDRAKRRERWHYNGERTTLRSITFDPRHNRIAVGGDGSHVAVLDTTDGHLLTSLQWKTNQVAALQFTTDGNQLVTTDGLGNLKIWDMATIPPREVMTIAAHPVGISSLAVHPDGVHLATGDMRGEIKLWAIGQNTPLATTGRTLTTVNDLAFDSTGKLLAAAHTDGTVWLLDAATLSPVRALRGHQGVVSSVCFQPGGGRLASSGADRTIRIWDVSSAAQLLTLRSQRRAIQHVTFSPDGNTLASTSLDGTVQLWDSPATR